jgi:uncharacterized protein YbjT (DUF2867 family)
MNILPLVYCIIYKDFSEASVVGTIQSSPNFVQYLFCKHDSSRLQTPQFKPVHRQSLFPIMASNLKVLVTGATGKQGGADVNALLSSSIAPFITMFAPTRDVESQSAKKLSSKSKNIRLVKGQMEDAHALFNTIGDKIDMVYCVTIPSMKKNEQAAEEKQGKAMVDAAVANGVGHFVFSSVDRGGSDKSDHNPTPVPHFISKHNIELYLKQKAAESGERMSWTILRPTFFLDNLD